MSVEFLESTPQRVSAALLSCLAAPNPPQQPSPRRAARALRVARGAVRLLKRLHKYKRARLKLGKQRSGEPEACAVHLDGAREISRQTSGSGGPRCSFGLLPPEHPVQLAIEPPNKSSPKQQSKRHTHTHTHLTWHLPDSQLGAQPTLLEKLPRDPLTFSS